MTQRARYIACLTAAALTFIACGSRVVPLSSDAQGNPISGFDNVNPTGEPVPGATGSLAPGVDPTTGASVGPSVGPRAILPNCTPGTGDVGVTKDTIKLGLIASINGPLKGQFDSAVQAVDAYFKGLNEAGGICGRRIQLLIRDDQGNGANNLAIAKKLVEEEKIFAFVGSHSAPDDSGIAKVSKEHKVPDLGFSLTWERAENKYSYGVPGQVQREWIGEGASGSKWLNEVNDIEQIAIFWLRESEVSILSAWGFEAAMIRTTNRERGKPIKICHEQPAGVVDTNYNNYVIAMKGNCDPADGPIGVYTTMENNANINLARAMRQQQFGYKIFAPTFSSYLPTFISQANGATEGAYIAMPQVPIERLEQPQSTWTPGTQELRRYLATLKRFYPNHKPTGSFGGPAWGSAALFTDAAAHCGANLTRACVLNRLETMPPFSAGGFLTPVAPGTHRIYTADLIVQVRNGRFVEVRPSDKSGPAGGPDFWDTSELFNWQVLYCSTRENTHADGSPWWPNRQAKDSLIDRC
ncbi:MAG TPA: ABC transporter substrate-binding protein [Actinomycetota bacterium]